MDKPPNNEGKPVFKEILRCTRNLIKLAFATPKYEKLPDGTKIKYPVKGLAECYRRWLMELLREDQVYNNRPPDPNEPTDRQTTS